MAENPVHHKGNSGHIATVLQEGKQQKQHQHQRQESGHRTDTGHHAVNHKGKCPLGSAGRRQQPLHQSGEEAPKFFHDAGQPHARAGKPLNEQEILAEGAGKQQIHDTGKDRQGQDTVGENLIQLTVPLIVAVFVELDRITAYFFCRCHQGSHDAVL